MLRWLVRTLFLTKEIRSQAGVLHFQRFRLIQTPWFAIYVHRISASDEEKHAHDHPFDFLTFLLRGEYEESWAKCPHWSLFMKRRVRAGRWAFHDHTDVHKIKLLTPVVWSLVFAGGHKYDWGYQTNEGWVDHRVYRLRKRGVVTGWDRTV